MEITPYQGYTGVLPPIGAVFAWLKTLTGTPQTLPTGWVECNGQTLSDASSPYNGGTIPNLNGSGAQTQRLLRGSTTSGSVGGSETHNHEWFVRNTPYGSFTTTGASKSLPTVDDFDPGAASDKKWDMYADTDSYTNKISSLPSYYEVVWIMRVK
jgi:hypothetical protein